MDGYRVALAIVRQRQEAEDALQEAAEAAWVNRLQVRDPNAMRAWFLAIVTNRCRMRLRSSWWRRGRAVGADPGLDDVAGPSHEDMVETRVDLRRALIGLSWDQRAVLAMYYQLDMPQEDIARALRIRVGTVKSRLSRATAALKRVALEDGMR
jgi:RNA polymerase sigma-70 factor (ECF subfamily)